MQKKMQIFLYYIYLLFNKQIISISFPSSLKCANVNPVFKKGYETCKEL